MGRSIVEIAGTFGPATSELQQDVLQSRQAVTREATAKASGIAQGTRVMTLDGAISVEYLTPGDRVITRSGMRRLSRIDVTEFDDLCPCRISAAALGHDRPENDVEVGPATRLYVRGWRAAALYGRDTASVDADRLADGEYISIAESPRKMRLFTLTFENPEVFYAEGLEVASTT